MKRNVIIIFIVVLSVSILLVTFLSISYIDSVQPDPYFHVKITPIIYWIGFSLAIFITLGVIFSDKSRHSHYGLGFFSVLLLSVYVYVIPKFFYINSIYTDTYIFVTELFYTLSYGHVGLGHSQETPGLALFSSQFSLITGIDHMIVAEFLPLIMAVIVILLIYVIGQLLANKRVALLACLFFVSVFYFGIYFNRQSFALLLQFFSFYAILKVFSHRDVSISWYAVILLSYMALVVSHPLSSLAVWINTLAVTFSTFAASLVGRLRRVDYKFEFHGKLLARSLRLSVCFAVVWLFWQMNSYRYVNDLVHALIQAVNELFISPSPTAQVGRHVSEYTAQYGNIVNLRLFEMAFVGAIGILVALVLFFKGLREWRASVVSSWFLSTMTISVWGIYGTSTQARGTRGFYYAAAPFALLLAWYIISTRHSVNIAESDKKKKRGKMYVHWSKPIKWIIISVMMVFMFLLPLAMYTNSPFMYPPTAHLNEIDFVTRYGSGSGAVFEVSSEILYYQQINNNSEIIIGPVELPTNITNYQTLVTGFRAFTKDAFIIFDPPLTQHLLQLQLNLTTNPRPAFAKIYDGGLWYRIYTRQNNVSSVQP